MRELIAHQDPLQRILVGDVREGLRSLPDASVQMCVTSPPYWGLRAYGTDPQVWGGAGCDHEWGDEVPQYNPTRHADRETNGKHGYSPLGAVTPPNRGCWCQRCEAWRGELGSEPTPRLFIEHMLEVFAEVYRVLRPDGVAFVNMGDSYNAGGRTGHGTRVGYKQGTNRASANGEDSVRPSADGLKPKDLIGIPWMLAFALRDELGFTLRQDIIWQKPAPMPESVTDRCTKSHEYLFLLAKSERYFFDNEAIKEPLKRPEELGRKTPAVFGGKDKHAGYGTRIHSGNEYTGELSGRNKRSVWTINTQPYKGAHFATFPPKLVIPCIQAGTSEHGCCSACGAPWRRVVERSFVPQPDVCESAGVRGAGSQKPMDASNGWEGMPRGTTHSSTTGWKPGCTCNAEVIPCTVLDPFLGSGTSLQVARHLGRRGIGCELNETYATENAMVRISEPVKQSQAKAKRIRKHPKQKDLFGEETQG